MKICRGFLFIKMQCPRAKGKQTINETKKAKSPNRSDVQFRLCLSCSNRIEPDSFCESYKNSSYLHLPAQFARCPKPRQTERRSPFQCEHCHLFTSIREGTHCKNCLPASFLINKIEKALRGLFYYFKDTQRRCSADSSIASRTRCP